MVRAYNASVPHEYMSPFPTLEITGFLINLTHISRTDLRSTPSSPNSVSSDGELNHQWRRQLEELFDNGVNETQNEETRNKIEAADGSDEEAYDFKLFSAKIKQPDTCAPRQSKIVLKSPSPGPEESGFISQVRPRNYYFTGPRTEQEQCQYREVAMNGDDVMKASHSRWPGFEIPWRVFTIKIDASKSAKIHAETVKVVSSVGITKPGKKRRIAMRIKRRAREEREKTAQAVEAEKMVLDREKRTRRNREKKVKRREKARNEKEEAKADAVVD
ncbi:MAG: hypothetical protein Q9222_004509 [Ikaeria aurantiellina]